MKCPVHEENPNCGWPANDLPDIDGYEPDDPKSPGYADRLFDRVGR